MSGITLLIRAKSKKILLFLFFPFSGYSQTFYGSFALAPTFYTTSNSRITKDGDLNMAYANISVKSATSRRFQFGCLKDKEQFSHALWLGTETGTFELSCNNIYRTATIYRKLNFLFLTGGYSFRYKLYYSKKMTVNFVAEGCVQKLINSKKAMQKAIVLYDYSSQQQLADKRDTLLLNAKNGILPPIGIGLAMEVLINDGSRFECTFFGGYDQTIRQVFAFSWYWPDTTSPLLSGGPVKKCFSVGLRIGVKKCKK